MANPPPTPPSSDLQGVNRDARVNSPPPPEAGSAETVQHAKAGSKARPDETKPLEGGAGDRDT